MERHLKTVLSKQLRHEFRPPEFLSQPIKAALEELAALPPEDGNADNDTKPEQPGQRLQPQTRGSSVPDPTNTTAPKPEEV